MATIQDVLNNFNSVNLRQQVPKIIMSLSAEMVDLNLNQLSKGLTTEGVQITPAYQNSRYAAYKSEIGSLASFGTPNLKLTGDFYSGFYIQLKGITFNFGSNDQKSALLEGKYSKNGGIYGLTDQSKSDLSQNDVKPRLVEYLREKTGLPKY